MTDEIDPKELLRQFYPLEGAIAPLAELIRVNPILTEEILRLAMTLAIFAASKRHHEDTLIASIRNMVSPRW